MNPSDEDIGRMQQEAVRRVRDMQQRAKNMSAARNNGRQNQPQQEQPATTEEKIEYQKHEAEENLQSCDSPSDMRPNDTLSGLFKDKEKSLILLLLVLLGGDEENSGIVLALLYLLI